MNIGVDATCWQNTRGYGRHARSLLKALIKRDSENRYVLFLDSDEAHETLPYGADVCLVRSKKAPTAIAASANGHRSAADMWRMAHSLSKADVDVLLFPTIYSYVPVVSRAKKITVIHDVIAERYPNLTMPSQRSRLFWKTKVALGRWQADAVATVSNYSRQAIVKHFGIDAELVHVVGEASDPVFRVLENPSLPPRLKALGLNESQKLIVYVGGFSPHKNLEALVSVFEKLVREPSFGDARLVLVGEDKKEVFHSYSGVIKNEIESRGLQGVAMFTGYLSDEDLVVLLNLATVSVLPSLMEGFGLPAIEAAACGCPVIATKESPLPELLEGGGLYFDPRRSDQLEDCLRRALESEKLRQTMSAAGLEAASRLTWDHAADQMLTLIRKVAS